MSLRLLLVRHAKAAPISPGGSDRDRPLSDRGRRAASRMGRRLGGQGVLPSLVLCSDAARARETMELLLASWPHEPEVRILPELYDRIDVDYLDIVRFEPEGATAVMLVGHNPAAHATALALARPEARQGELREGFPTGAVAVLDFDAATWPALVPAGGRLAAFLRPED